MKPIIYFCKIDFVPKVFFFFFPDEDMLLIRKELCRVNFGIRLAAGPPKVESKRAHSLSLPLFF